MWQAAAVNAICPISQPSASRDRQAGKEGRETGREDRRLPRGRQRQGTTSSSTLLQLVKFSALQSFHKSFRLL